MAREGTIRPRARGTDEETARAPRINHDESPLAWLARRKDKEGQPLISREQFEAGERLRRDFTYALLEPRVTASWSAVASDRGSRRWGGQSADDLTDGVVAARTRVNKALSSVGPDLAGILLDVCCYLKGLEACERAAGWPQRSAKVVLTIALQQLARHYGLIAPATPAASSRIQHWGAPGYRPQISTGAIGESEAET